MDIQISNLIVDILGVVGTISLAVLAIIISYKFSKKADEASKTQLFMRFRQDINTVDERVKSAGIANQLNVEHPQAKVYYAAYQAMLEAYLNVFDDACIYYLANKLDKELFKQAHSKEIKTLIEITPNPYCESKEEWIKEYPNIYKVYIELKENVVLITI